MNMVDRAKNLLVQPKEEWRRIDAEPVETVEFYRSYIGPLAATRSLMDNFNSGRGALN